MLPWVVVYRRAWGTHSLLSCVLHRKQVDAEFTHGDRRFSRQALFSFAFRGVCQSSNGSSTFVMPCPSLQESTEGRTDWSASGGLWTRGQQLRQVQRCREEAARQASPAGSDRAGALVVEQPP